MAKEIGRNLIIQKNSVTIASVRSKSFSWAGETIDVTDDDLSGVRELLPVFGSEALEISVEGLANSAVFRDIALTRATSKVLTDISLERVGRTFSITGSFVVVSYEESGTYNDAITFSCTLQSNGNWTYVA